MELTAQQVKEKLHIGDRRLFQLIESGKLPTSNVRRADAKKFFRRFDSAVVNRVAAELKTNGHSKAKVHLSQPIEEVDYAGIASQREWKAVSTDTGKTVIKSNTTAEPVGKGIMSRLKSIEEKLDLLMKAWL